jgi:hypothetical protein
MQVMQKNVDEPREDLTWHLCNSTTLEHPAETAETRARMTRARKKKRTVCLEPRATHWGEQGLAIGHGRETVNTSGPPRRGAARPHHTRLVLGSHNRHYKRCVNARRRSNHDVALVACDGGMRHEVQGGRTTGGCQNCAFYSEKKLK